MIKLFNILFLKNGGGSAKSTIMINAKTTSMNRQLEAEQ